MQGLILTFSCVIPQLTIHDLEAGDGQKPGVLWASKLEFRW